MKNLLIIATLVFALMFPSTSFAEWKKVSKGVDGSTYYVDFERIRKHDGYVYFWSLEDYSKDDSGNLSYKTYKQGDCKLFRYKIVSEYYYKQAMGKGGYRFSRLYKPDTPWDYPPPPDSVHEDVLKSVCSR